MCPDLPTKRDFYKRSVSRHNFHRHLIAISVDLNGSYVCVIQQKVKHSAFNHASFPRLSDVHEYSGGLQIAPSPLDKQSADCNSPHDWLMSWPWIKRYADVKMAPMPGCHLAVF